MILLGVKGQANDVIYHIGSHNLEILQKLAIKCIQVLRQ